MEIRSQQAHKILETQPRVQIPLFLFGFVVSLDLGLELGQYYFLTLLQEYIRTPLSLSAFCTPFQ